ncbi:hypothetical protein [Protaetiibacter intestinalis]|uniref:DUF3137 domain-containing protein n=1 Tax=Protaetiibacter intestinalis TaxID=2419774 RepID=A0A387B561_9MICO|nr:hypothetical protein [Protaetiibacter intestinalis]AYF96841.1 hypothetical protein D7I47_00290 [Protaetiibacter intestinalis]
MTATTPAWDITPLTEPLTREQVRTWRRANRDIRSGAASPLWVITAVPVLVLALVYVGAMVSTLARRADFGGPSALALLAPLAIVALVVVAFAGALLAGRGATERLMRLVRFAQANGFTFSPRDADPSYPGMVFGIGRRRTAIDHIRRSSPRFLDIGNFRYTTGSGKNKKTRTWGFMALHLDRRVPHMLLDARANNLLGMSNLPATFSKDQVLSLEGDFDEHFTLYCPREYERDALYVFTPDLMAVLIDEAGAFDVEVIDDWMFVYQATPLRMGEAATMERLLRIVDTVGAKTVAQTDYYADERVGDRNVNLVAPQGARLRRGVPWVAIAAGGVFVAIWFALTFLR